MYVSMYVCMNVYTYVGVYVCKCEYAYVRMHIYMFLSMCVCMQGLRIRMHE